jgi:hypothetical protein
MTTLEKVDALAKQLSAAERALLAKRWLAEDCAEPDTLSELDTLIATVGKVVSGRRTGETPVEEDPLWALGTDPVDLGVTDAAVNHDHYAYGYRSQHQ